MPLQLRISAHSWLDRTQRLSYVLAPGCPMTWYAELKYKYTSRGISASMAIRGGRGHGREWSGTVHKLRHHQRESHDLTWVSVPDVGGKVCSGLKMRDASQVVSWRALTCKYDVRGAIASRARVIRQNFQRSLMESVVAFIVSSKAAGAWIDKRRLHTLFLAGLRTSFFKI